MKTIKTAIVLLFGIFLIMSCSKKDPAPDIKMYPEEDPLVQFLIKAGFINKSSGWQSFGNYEMGFTFKPLVNGKINALVINIPFATPSLKVTIWDVTTKLAIRSETVNVKSAEIDMTTIITPVELIKDKEYLISMNSDSYYIHSSNLFNPANANYPITIGNISILKTNSSPNATNTSIYPSVIILNQYSGNCSFKFQQSN